MDLHSTTAQSAAPPGNKQLPATTQLDRSLTVNHLHLPTLFAAFGAIALSVSCNSDDRPAAPQDDEPANAQTTTQETTLTDLAALAGTEWKLVDLCGVNVPEESNASINFLNDGRVAGNGSVNRFNGPMRITDGRLVAGPIASTLMAGPPDDMKREHLFLTALNAAKSIHSAGDRELIIVVDEKDLPLRFRALPSH